ncbi:MAG: hypothetical protein AAFZ65_18045, partial [Planctomycetota bacterium]
YHDLGRVDGRVVAIDSAGWRVEESTEAVFFRSRLTGALPVPERGGALAELWDVVNVSPADHPMVLAWLVANLFPDLVHPILLLLGRRGTGKSTAGQKLKSLIDPSPSGLVRVPTKEDDWATTASHQWVVGVDNVSEIKAWFSDALCRTATGEGITKRRLYSDNGVVMLTFRRSTLLTAIDLGILRGDLAQRAMIVELMPFGEAGYAGEIELNRLFQQAKPRILGAVYDLAADVLRTVRDVRLDSPGRLVEFEKILAAIDQIQGTRGLDRYRSTASRVAIDVVESTPVGLAVAQVAARTGSWAGTFGQLLKQIERYRTPRDWPTSPRLLGSQVRRMADELEEVGIAVRLPDDAHRAPTANRERLLHLEVVDEARLEQLLGRRPSGSPSASPTRSFGDSPSRSSSSSDGQPTQRPSSARTSHPPDATFSKTPSEPSTSSEATARPTAEGVPATQDEWTRHVLETFDAEVVEESFDITPIRAEDIDRCSKHE